MDMLLHRHAVVSKTGGLATHKHITQADSPNPAYLLVHHSWLLVALHCFLVDLVHLFKHPFFIYKHSKSRAGVGTEGEHDDVHNMQHAAARMQAWTTGVSRCRVMPSKVRSGLDSRAKHDNCGGLPKTAIT